MLIIVKQQYANAMPQWPVSVLLFARVSNAALFGFTIVNSVIC